MLGAPLFPPGRLRSSSFLPPRTQDHVHAAAINSSVVGIVKARASKRRGPSKLTFKALPLPHRSSPLRLEIVSAGRSESRNMTEPTTAAAADPAAVLAHVEQHWAAMQPHSPVYDFFFAELALVSAVAAPQARVVARLPVRARHVNSKGGLHGAVSAALVDWAGGMALAASGLHATGVSVDIHVSYVAAARERDELEVEAWVVRRGRTLGFTGVEIRKVGDGGAVVATGSHTKFIGGGPKPGEAARGEAAAGGAGDDAGGSARVTAGAEGGGP